MIQIVENHSKLKIVQKLKNSSKVKNNSETQK